MQGRERDDEVVQAFDTSCDDSSDEESVDKKVSVYQIDENWEKYKKTKGKLSHAQLEDDMFSFIAHAAGIQLFYSKKVNLIYYPQKKTLLNPGLPKTSVQLIDLVEVNTKLAFGKTIKSLKLFLSNIERKKLPEKNLDELYKKTLSEIIPNIQDLIKTNIAEFILWVKENRYREYFTERKKIIELEESIIKLFVEILIEKLQLKSGSTDRVKIKQDLTELAMTEFYRLSKKFELGNKENAEGKKAAILLLEKYKGPYKNLCVKIIDVLKSCNARGYVENMIIKKIEEECISPQIMSAYISDLVELNENKKLLEKYYSYDKESIKDELDTSLTIQMKNNFKNTLKYFHRTVLDKNYSFVCDNPYTFYANLRLASRSQKRHILNLKNTIFKNDSVLHIWKFGKIQSSETDVLETEEISSLSFARKAMILDVGNYEKVYNCIKLLKLTLAQQDIECDDKLIASWIRTIFNGKEVIYTPFTSMNINIHAKLQSICYLLFGCEAMRNPAMIILNQMLLDLIMNDDEWSFEEAFTKSKNGEVVSADAKFMPMIPEGAVSVARGHETDLRKYMPYPYFYSGIEENSESDDKFSKSDLIKAEARIMRDWLKLQNFTLKKITKDTFLSKIMAVIEKNYTQWFSNPKLEKKHGLKR